MNVIDDIIKKIKLNSFDIYLQVLKDLKDFEYNKKNVIAFSAMGDCYTYTVKYTIGDFQFEYEHFTSDCTIMMGNVQDRVI